MGRVEYVFQIDITPGELKMYKKYHSKSVVPWEGLLDSFDATNYIIKSHVKGDIVECGVWRGGAIALIKDTVHKIEPNSNRHYWLYDTFSGMANMSKHDIKQNKFKTDTVKKFKNNISHNGVNNWFYAGLEEVKNTIKKTSGGLKNTYFIKGKVEDTLRKGNIPKKIALLRLDTDFYKSTKIELQVLLPLLSNGGIVIIDDFGNFEGARKATDEILFKNSKQFSFFKNHSNGALIGIKSKY